MYSQMDEATNISLSTNTIQSNNIPRRPRHGGRKTKNVYSTYIPNRGFSRYYSTLAGLRPFRINQNKTELLVESVGFFSFMTFNWVVSYLKHSFNSKNDVIIPKCPKIDNCKSNAIRLDGLFNNQEIRQGQQNLSVLRVVLNFVRTRMIFACILYILAALISMLGLVLFLPNILQLKDIKFVFFFIVCEFFSCFLYSASNAINLRTAIRLRSACFVSLYRQALHTSLTYNISSWQLVSFLLSEGQHVHNLVLAIPDLICTPIILACCLIFAGTYLHLWGYMSVLIVTALFPIFIIIALLSNKLLYKATFFSDLRVKFLEEFILNNIYVKYLKLEKYFKDNIASARKNEMNCIKRAGLYDNLCFSFIFLQPFLSLFALYVGFYYNNKDKNNNIDGLDVSMFAAVSIIVLIHVKKSLDNFWCGLNNFCKGISALEKYKKLKVFDTISLMHKKPADETLAIYIEDANFQFTKEHNILHMDNSDAKMLFQDYDTYLKNLKGPTTQDVLHDINMKVEQGKLIGICGMSGSGRSSLLLAIMGLLIKSKGGRYTSGHFAYINQEPLIFNDSIKNNVLFGSVLDSQRYYRVTNHCGLHELFSQLPEQDDTIINSKLLSLEQKQRIILARALYENTDIYLLDEPLSALNFNQSMRIFEDCLKNSLNDKTVLLVTDQIKFLEQCDEVYLMDKGTIILKGQHDALIQSNTYYADFIQYLNKQKTICKDKSNLFEISPDVYTPQTVVKDADNISIMTESKDSLYNSDLTDTIIKMKDSKSEQHAFSNILRIYLSYFGNCVSITVLFCAQIINAILITCLPVYFIISLVLFEEYITNCSIYVGLFLLVLISGLLINIYFNKKMFTVSKLFHNDILKKMYRCTFAFLQTNSFRVISTFSVQLQLTDYDIPHSIQNIFLNIFAALMISCIVAFTSLWYIIFIVFISLILIFITRFTRKALSSYNRLNIKYTDALYTQVLNMLTARPIIQAYDKIDFDSKRLYDVHDEYITNLYIIYASKSWFNLITRCFAIVLIACIGLALILLEPNCSIGSLTLFNNDLTTNESIACKALAIVCILQFCYVFQKVFILYLNLGLSFDTLAQVEKFKMSIDDEAPYDDDDDDDDEDDYDTINNYDKMKTLIGQTTNIKFSNVTLQLEVPVLNAMSFFIRENEKTGFFGLSSSERKAIIAILYKFSNISSGSVMIGKRRITHFPLRQLRSLISVIPTEPYLFNFSIKRILSCPTTVTETEVLQKFMLFERVNSFPNKIDSNADQLLNTEEKQILLLARAYVQQAPIIIVEDYMNGSILEYILGVKLRELFPQTIVLIFANNITGLNKCDTVLIVKDGKVVQSDNVRNTMISLETSF